MMDKQKTAETMLEVLKAGALVESGEKQELWISALVAGLAEVERLDRQNPAEKLYDALNTVKEHCTSQGTSCYGCLLSTDAVYGGCDFLDENPEDWDLGFLKGGTDGKL